jgi:hypothetical protein
LRLKKSRLNRKAESAELLQDKKMKWRKLKRMKEKPTERGKESNPKDLLRLLSRNDIANS